MIKINMEKAKEIKRNEIRRNRVSLFAELDIAFMKAVESADIDSQKNIAVKKQALRDAPKHPDIDNAKTIEELKGVDPLKLVG